MFVVSPSALVKTIFFRAVPPDVGETGSLNTIPGYFSIRCFSFSLVIDPLETFEHPLYHLKFALFEALLLS